MWITDVQLPCLNFSLMISRRWMMRNPETSLQRGPSVESDRTSDPCTLRHVEAHEVWLQLPCRHLRQQGQRPLPVATGKALTADRGAETEGIGRNEVPGHGFQDAEGDFLAMGN